MIVYLFLFLTAADTTDYAWPLGSIRAASGTEGGSCIAPYLCRDDTKHCLHPFPMSEACSLVITPAGI